jgi:membrane protein YqaA with SNARE-associated domain
MGIEGGGGAAEDSAVPHAEGRWTRLAGHPAAPALLFAFAVVEGCLFPAPTEALYAALALAHPRRSWALAMVAAAGSVAGGVVAWTLGAWFYERLGERVLARYGLLDRVQTVSDLYRQNAALALVTSGYTPVPYVLYGIVAGASGIGLGTFAAFSAVGRGLKYAILAGVARLAGPTLRRWMERSRAAVVLVLALIAAFMVMGLMAIVR